MTSFLVLTTRNLPEAYFLVDFLVNRGQNVAIVNFKGRPTSHNLNILKRLQKKRGTPYVFDLLLGKFLRPYVIPGQIEPFTNITPQAIQSYTETVPYFESNDPHDRATLAYIQQCSPSYILTAGAPILKESFFSLPTSGTLNLHLGWAPTYRGSDCPLWTLSQGAFHEVGFIVHYMTKRIDRGDLLTRETVPIQAGRSLSHFLAHLQLTASTGYTSVIDALISNGELARMPQEPGGAHFPPAGLSTMLKAKRNYDRFVSQGCPPRAVPAPVQVNTPADRPKGKDK